MHSKSKIRYEKYQLIVHVFFNFYNFFIACYFLNFQTSQLHTYKIKKNY